MTDKAIDAALDVAFVALCTIAAEAWVIGIVYTIYDLWLKP